jgi:DNA polymerase I
MATADGGREERMAPLQLFAWLREPPSGEAIAGLQVERLKGEGAFPWLAHADSPAAYDALLNVATGVDGIRPLESQFLLQTRARLFSEISFAQLRRCQLDIETASGDGYFSNAARPEDRVLAIGLRFGARDRTLVLAEETDAAEKSLLEDLNAVLAAEDPDVIEGHNIFKFDLDYLRQRCKRHKVPCA